MNDLACLLRPVSIRMGYERLGFASVTLRGMQHILLYTGMFAMGEHDLPRRCSCHGCSSDYDSAHILPGGNGRSCHAPAPSFPSDPEGYEQIMLIPSNQEQRIEGIVRALCRELFYRGKSFTLTVVADRTEAETVRIIEKLMLRQGMELSYLSAVPTDMEQGNQSGNHSIRLIDLREPKQ